jgi:hypothetical protein
MGKGAGGERVAQASPSKVGGGLGVRARVGTPCDCACDRLVSVANEWRAKVPFKCR